MDWSMRDCTFAIAPSALPCGPRWDHLPVWISSLLPCFLLICRCVRACVHFRSRPLMRRPSLIESLSSSLAISAGGRDGNDDRSGQRKITRSWWRYAYICVRLDIEQRRFMKQRGWAGMGASIRILMRYYTLRKALAPHLFFGE